MNAAPTFEDLLSEWQKLVKELKAMTAKEKKLRQALFDSAFPTPKEGVNTRELADGRIVKGTHKINRTVDEAVLATVREHLPALSNEITFDDLFKFKPSLQIGPYRKLSDSALHLVNTALTSKPGTPTLEVE